MHIKFLGRRLEIEVNHYYYDEFILMGVPAYDEECDYTVIEKDKVIPKDQVTNEMDKVIMNHIRARHGVDLESK